MKNGMKTLFSKFYYKLDFYKRSMYLMYLSKKYKIHILSAEETIDRILSQKISISRYGDGELNLILSDKSIGFQKYHPGLKEKLIEVLKSNVDNLLICLPHTLDRYEGENLRAHDFWELFNKKNKKTISTLLEEFDKKDYIFGDTQVTRPYMDYNNVEYTDHIYKLLRKIWDDKNILIVEGSKTCMGVGNDLFSNAKSIQRIICPAENAFSSYDTILSSVLAHSSQSLILIALGPAATVLAYDLAKHGRQALDVGHLDIEYEWYIKQCKEKIAIPGKYVNEISDKGDSIDIGNEAYQKEIIERINC